MSSNVIRQGREDYATVVGLVFSEQGSSLESPDVFADIPHDLSNPYHRHVPTTRERNPSEDLPNAESGQDHPDQAARDGGDAIAALEQGVEKDVSEDETLSPSVQTPVVIMPEMPDFRELVQTAYDLGYREAAEAQRRRIDPMVERLKDALDKLSLFSRHLTERARAEAADIAVTLAEHLLQDHIRVDPSILLRQAREEIERLRGREEILVRLHPDVYQAFGGLADELQHDLPGVARILLQRDPTLESAGCVIDTDMEQIDLTWSSRLQQLLSGPGNEEKP